MKNIILVAFILFSGIFVNAQTETNIAFNKDMGGKVFNSYEDFIAKKPIDGINIKCYTKNYGSDTYSKLVITKDGTEEIVKDSKLTYSWFCDGAGNLLRVFDGNVYFVIDIGPICFYYRCREAGVSYQDGVYYCSPFGLPPDQVFREYYSEKITGEIVVLKDKVWDAWLEKYGLKDQFEAEKSPKREIKDSVTGYEDKKRRIKTKYKKLLNQKMK